MAFYREVEFRAGDLHQVLDARDRIEALPGIRVLFAHHRRLGFLERERLFADEHVARLVLAIATEDLKFHAEGAGLGGFDPYRVPFGEAIRTINPGLAAILDELGAGHREVTSGLLYFTVPLISPRHGRLIDAVRERAGELGLRCEDAPDDGEIVMRIGGEIPPVVELADMVVESGLLRQEELRVRYG
ncbi:MAG: hypothetical protein KC420_08215 [Myxococcales bacterium]|nr:hypothetical protein [Myxococcales bacterium]MCB9568392.1 hypothetical protein [Myxococcales bacterium]MCB9705115.1 hypothetical protein [Myxococcales bacterium]